MSKKKIESRISRIRKAFLPNEFVMNPSFTCAAMVERIKYEEGLIGVKSKNSWTYMSGSISSTLRQLVDKEYLQYHPTLKGPRGGHVYQLKSQNKEV